VIGKIILQKFRNLKEKSFEFSPKTTVIVGPNASGKTNILESLFLLSTGKSFHARLEEEMINYNVDISRIKGRISTNVDLECILTRGEVEVGDSKIEKTPRKRLLVNGIPRRLIDFAGNFKVVLFGPWDMNMVVGEPSLRRRFLDTVLSQVDREYRRASLSYEKGLRQRNRLLFRIREEDLSRNQLLFWDKLLIKNGDYISNKRGEFIEFCNSQKGLDDQNFSLTYDKSAISESRLAQYSEEEVASATTLVGPHRDDFVFKFKEKDLARYGSRGEQRMGVLWIKLAELTFIELKSGDLPAQVGKPTLLLDDIFSELDHQHRNIVMNVVGKQQTIITTADEHFVGEMKGNIIKL